jgi:hypothetical protein
VASGSLDCGPRNLDPENCPKSAVLAALSRGEAMTAGEVANGHCLIHRRDEILGGHDEIVAVRQFFTS